MEPALGSLNERDMEFVETLWRLGVQRSIAVLIAFLAGNEEVSSKDIQAGTGISQPSVSLAVKSLRDKGWIDEHKIRSGKKGRSTKVYRLRVTVDEIIRYFEEKKTHESARVMTSIQRLKELASS